MGHYALIIAAAFVLIGSVLSLGLRSDTRDAEEQSAKLLMKEEAREASFTGLNLTLRKLVSHPDTTYLGTEIYGIDSTDYKRSTFWTTVTPKLPGGDTVDVESVGRKYFLDPSGNYTDTTHTINVRLIYTDFSDSIPPAWKYAIMSEMDFIVSGSMEVLSFDGVNNANIHSNEILKSNGRKYLVEGYGTYTIDERVRHKDGFQPVDDENGIEPNVYQDKEIPFPQVDWASLRAQAQASNTYSDEHFVIDPEGAGYTSFADWAIAAGNDPAEGIGTSPDKPLVVFSETTMEVASDMILDGYGILASLNGTDSTSTGTEIHGNLIIEGGIDTNEDGSSTNVVIASQGGVFINGNSQIAASLYSAGEIDFNGDAVITGGLVARNVATTGGNLTLTWVGLNSKYGRLFPPFNEVFGPRIAAWSEW